MTSPKFKAQLIDMRTEIQICNSLDFSPRDINYEDYHKFTDEDLAWAAYSVAFEPAWETELSLYCLYYLLISRVPKLVKEVSMPALFRPSLQTPELYPLIDKLLSNYDTVQA